MKSLKGPEGQQYVCYESWEDFVRQSDGCPLPEVEHAVGRCDAGRRIDLRCPKCAGEFSIKVYLHYPELQVACRNKCLVYSFWLNNEGKGAPHHLSDDPVEKKLA